MIFGMTTSTYTLITRIDQPGRNWFGVRDDVRVAQWERLDGWTALFLVKTVATSVTGFGFPFHHLLPSHKVGIISLVVPLVAILAR